MLFKSYDPKDIFFNGNVAGLITSSRQFFASVA